MSVSIATAVTTVRVLHESACPEIGPICDDRDEPAQLHDQRFYVAELRPVVEYGLSEHFGIEAQFPLRVTRTTVRYRRLDDTLFAPDYVNIHHRDETLVGFGDPELRARASWRLGAIGFSARVGVSLPLGRTEENPFALGRSGLEHQHIQFGTGTLDPLLGFEAGVPLGGLDLRAYTQARLVLSENEHGFRSGNRYALGVAGERPVAGRLSGSVGIDVVSEQPERWDGRVEQDGNLGRTDILAGVTASLPLGGFSVRMGVHVPVYQRIIESGDHDGGQLTYPAIFRVTLGRTFDLR